MAREEDRKIVRQDMDALYIGNLNTVEFDLNLPEKGPNGSDITWESGNERLLRPDGRVMQPKYGMGSRNVLLTATFRHGDAELKKAYDVHVLEERNKIKIKKVYPVRLRQKRGENFFLPAVAVVETAEGSVIAHAVAWEGDTQRKYGQCGKYSVDGMVAGTDVPVHAQVTITEELERSRKDTTPAVRPFAPREAKLAPDGDFWEAQQRSLTFLLSVDDDQMLYNFRRTAGLNTKGAPEMIGWDAPNSLLRGHTTGHYLSALALCYETFGDERIRRKAEYMLTSLQECQRAFSGRDGFHKGFLGGYSEMQFDQLEQYVCYPQIWAPYYTLHKIFAGLLDCNRAFHTGLALAIARALGDWVYRRLSRLSHDQLVTMWSLYIAGEFGGMNDVMAQLYQLTGEEKYLTAAHFFDNDKLLYPLEQKVDALNGMHANQHIPQVIGAMRIFEATGDKKYYDIASFFWRIVVQDHVYVIGGTGEGEMFHRPGAVASLLTEHTAESCASYNMLKLTEELYAYDPDVRYMDYYERVMINHILSSGERKPTGASTYFMPLAPGFHKQYDEENSCCHGTGLENHFKYARNIYFKTDHELYVNLFLNSSAVWREKKITLEQKNSETAGIWKTSFSISGAADFSLNVRVPNWCVGTPTVRVNKCTEKATLKKGYLVLRRSWKSGDRVDVGFGCRLRLEYAPDDAGKAAVCWGPYVLAALTDASDYLRLNAHDRPLEDLLFRQGNEICFLLKEKNVEFIPLCRVEGQSYQVYLQS